MATTPEQKAARATYMRNYRASGIPREKHLQASRRKHQETKAFINTMKQLIGVCSKCGATSNIEKFEWHHREKHSKRFKIANAGTRSRQALLEELAKCDLLCPQCHKDVHLSFTYTAVWMRQRGPNAERYALDKESEDEKEKRHVRQRSNDRRYRAEGR
jgi:glutaredoxin